MIRSIGRQIDRSKESWKERREREKIRASTTSRFISRFALPVQRLVYILSLDSAVNLCSVLMLWPGKVQSKIKTRGRGFMWKITVLDSELPPVLKQELATASFRDKAQKQLRTLPELLRRWISVNDHRLKHHQHWSTQGQKRFEMYCMVV
jgi:hypothetical protein